MMQKLSQNHLQSIYPYLRTKAEVLQPDIVVPEILPSLLATSGG